jgi:hypothetical protein
VKNGEFTARVFVEPSIQLEGVSLVNDDEVAFVN